MAKFNLGIGDKLLNDTSREMKITGEWAFELIPLDEIDISPYSEEDDVSDIAEIKESILSVGLEQNLVVCPAENGRYRLVSGLRRYTALNELVAEGHAEYRLAPCKVKSLDKIDLPLSNDSKELLAFITTNVEVREQTDAFRLRMLRALSKIYDELKENGETKLGRRRAWVAEKLSVSPATIGIYEFVDKHLSEPFKEQLTSGDLDLTVAYKIAQMEPERQEQLWEESRETPDLSVSDVQGFAETGTLKKEEAKGKSKAKTYDTLECDTYVIDNSAFEYLDTLDELCDALKSESLTVSKRDMAKLLDAQKAIEKKLGIVRTIIEKAQAKQGEGE